MKTFGAASESKHDLVRSLGASPIDYRRGRLDILTRKFEPEGVDYVFDAVGGANIGLCIGALRRGGIVIGFGFVGAPGILSKVGMFANLFIGARLRGRRVNFYGISAMYRKDPKPLREDLPKIFSCWQTRRSTRSSRIGLHFLKEEKRSSFWREVRLRARSS